MLDFCILMRFVAGQGHAGEGWRHRDVCWGSETELAECKARSQVGQ